MPNKRYYRSRSKTSKLASNLSGLSFDLHGVPAKLLLITLICLIVGASCGGSSLYYLTRNDCFTLIPVMGQTTTIKIGGEGYPSTYEELGAKCISFGKDVSDSVKIKYLYSEDIFHEPKEVAKVDPTIEGTYYVVYTSTNLKYQTVQLVRKVNVTIVKTEEE